MDNRTEKCKLEYEGKHFFTKNGLREFVIVDYVSSAEVIVEFVGSGYRLTTTMSYINRGLPDPFEKSCICFDNKEQEFVGSYFRTNEGELVQVLQYNNFGDVHVRFQDEMGYIAHVTLQNLKNGEVKNPFHKNKFGGFVGLGEYNTKEFKWLYRNWYNMLIRANGQAYYNSYHDYETKAYDNVYLHPEWLSYNTFAEWYLKEISKLNPSYNYELDKDLLYPYYKDIYKCKCYGPHTCVLVPNIVNKSIVVAKTIGDFDSDEQYLKYKTEREAIIHNMAKTLYQNGALSEVAYYALSIYDLDENKSYNINREPKIDKDIYDRLVKSVNKKLAQ